MADHRNGVDVGSLAATVEAVQQKPESAKFTFSATTEWGGGAKSFTRIERLQVQSTDDPSRTGPYVVAVDEPKALLGTNTAPNPVELILSALTSCLAVGYSYNAAGRGIAIDALEFDIEGDLDLQGFLGLSEDVRPGYDSIRVTAHITSDAAEEDLRALDEHVQRTSPVLDILANPVPVAVNLTSARPAAAANAA